jgi:hypothetical protein
VLANSRFNKPDVNAINATSVGAKILNNPVPFSVSTRFAAERAVTSVEKDPFAFAVAQIW